MSRVILEHLKSTISNRVTTVLVAHRMVSNMLIPKAKTDSACCLTGTDNGTCECITCGAEQPPVYEQKEDAQTLKDDDTYSEDDGKKENIVFYSGVWV